MRPQRRAVSGQVVSDVLAEEGPAGLDDRIRIAIARVAEAIRCADSVKQSVVGFERGKIEHPTVAAGALDWCVDPLGG